jgi:hypothetical protein
MNNRIKKTDSKFKCNIFLFLGVTVFMARLSMHDLCMFVLYLVYITQVLKDTLFGLGNWCECGNLFIYFNETWTKVRPVAQARRTCKKVFVTHLWSGCDNRHTFSQVVRAGTVSLNLLMAVSSSSYPYPTKWGRYNMFFTSCDKYSEIIFTIGRLPEVNPP